MSAIVRVVVVAFALIGAAYVALPVFLWSGGTSQNRIRIAYVETDAFMP
ncbi:MAG TPA: hypothetical protein VGC55_02680 [Dokdonella sp.]